MRYLLRYPTILLIRFLQHRYIVLSDESTRKSVTTTSSALILIQSILYYFKQQFSPWGYFHPDCAWSIRDKERYNKLFPIKEIKENEIVVWHNPEAVVYYHNTIYTLRKGRNLNYKAEIERQLRQWNKWN